MQRVFACIHWLFDCYSSSGSGKPQSLLPSNIKLKIRCRHWLQCTADMKSVKLLISNTCLLYPYSGQNLGCFLWIRSVMFGSADRRKPRPTSVNHEIVVIASCTVSETWQVTGRKKRDFYLPHLSSSPNLTKLPFEFSDDVRIPCRGRIILWIREFLSNYVNVCDHNPPMLQTDRQTDEQTIYTIAASYFMVG